MKVFMTLGELRQIVFVENRACAVTFARADNNHVQLSATRSGNVQSVVYLRQDKVNRQPNHRKQKHVVTRDCLQLLKGNNICPMKAPEHLEQLCPIPLVFIPPNLSAPTKRI